MTRQCFDWMLLLGPAMLISFYLPLGVFLAQTLTEPLA